MEDDSYSSLFSPESIWVGQMKVQHEVSVNIYFSYSATCFDSECSLVCPDYNSEFELEFSEMRKYCT